MEVSKKLQIIEIISSSQLTAVQKEEIKIKAKEIFQLKNADYKFSEDRSLIGGFVIKFGSKVLDFSIKEMINGK